MNNKLSIALLCSLIAPGLLAQDSAPVSVAKSTDIVKTDVAKKTEQAKPASKEAVKPVEAKAESKPAAKPEMGVAQTGGKEVKATGPAKTTAPIWKKAEAIQNDVEKFINELAAHAKANPAEQEQALEQLGMLVAQMIGGIEQITGKSIFEEMMKEQPAGPMPMPAPSAKPAK